jgi:hypothetical protein
MSGCYFALSLRIAGNSSLNSPAMGPYSLEASADLVQSAEHNVRKQDVNTNTRRIQTLTVLTGKSITTLCKPGSFLRVYWNATSYLQNWKGSMKRMWRTHSTTCMEQSLFFLRGVKLTVAQLVTKFPPFLNRNVHCRVHKSPSLDIISLYYESRIAEELKCLRAFKTRSKWQKLRNKNILRLKVAILGANGVIKHRKMWILSK